MSMCYVNERLAPRKSKPRALPSFANRFIDTILDVLRYCICSCFWGCVLVIDGWFTGGLNVSVGR